jgi:anthranilate synthase/aminodeoxychorismate synthase-like glutamine amidotransferase
MTIASASRKVVLIDNYDSFTYNLAQYLGELGCLLEVHRNDQMTLDQIADLKPDRIVISPGPGTPFEAGVSMDVVRRFGEQVPILGVCLGHQAIAAVYGGRIVRAPVLKHGKTSQIHHRQEGILAGLPIPFEATRYHSLIVDREGLPECLAVTAWTDDDLIMGLKHREHLVFGVQFHPESVLTPDGMQILENFLCCRS